MNCLCVECQLKKHMATARQLGDEETAFQFTQAIMKLFWEATPEVSSASLGSRINRLYMEFYGLPQDRFQEEKRFSNQFVRQWLAPVRSRIAEADDPVLTALQYAILGNYIDFSALGKTVSFEVLGDMLSQPERFAFDTQDYSRFIEQIQVAKRLLILTDNAGEIGFDMILAQTLAEKYPQLEITFCVRGMPAHNDATREDAEFFGISFPVIDNGCDIGGTDLYYVNEETRDALKYADLIISKGMGNLETLYGCGLPIYYAFLVKCPRVQQVFGKPHMTSMFVKEK